MLPPLWLGAAYGASELLIALSLRSKTPAGDNTDRGSLRRIMLVIYASTFAAIYVSKWRPDWYFGNAYWYWTGIALFVAGLTVRWTAILWLGKFFTVNVAIADDHRVIDSGPYRYIRHPSYLGILLSFSGIALAVGNAASLLLFVVPPAAVLMHRMRIEEAALESGLGETYSRYMQRTKRLIPGVY